MITSSFQVIREESKTSAFTTEDQYVKRSLPVLPLELTAYRSLLSDDDDKPEKISALRRAYEKTYWVWIVTIILDLVAQALRSADMSDSVKRNISRFANCLVTVFNCLISTRLCGNSCDNSFIPRDNSAICQ